MSAVEAAALLFGWLGFLAGYLVGRFCHCGD